MSKVSSSGHDEIPHVQGAATAWAQEGQRSYSTIKVRRGGCEENPSSMVRSSGCALLEQL